MPATGSQDTDSSVHRGRQKRLRAIASCTDCHRSKQKCDRGTPCSNCVIRGKECTCRYEMYPPGKKRRGEQIIKLQTSGVSEVDELIGNDANKSDPVTPLSIFGFSKENRHTSLGLFRAIDAAEPLSFYNIPPQIAQAWNCRKWYKESIRQLPPPFVIDKLSTTFFKYINWQYNPLDYKTFIEQKEEWDRLPFSELNRGPQAIPADSRFFPALLFQLLALALIHRDPEDNESLECLKYNLDMSLDDVANEYSETGATLSVLLGKDISKIAIQAGFLRTLFLKTTGMVIESWESLGQTIEDARGLKWHLDTPSQESTVQDNPIQELWHSEICRRTWLNLCCWDAHMSTMLGMPMRITLKDIETIPPIDTPSIQDRNQSKPLPRAETDPPTPLTIQLFGHRITHFLLEIAMLQEDISTVTEISRIQELHDEILDFRENLPSYLWIENSDKKFDNHLNCFWLPDARKAVDATIWFAVLALHRKHIFTIPKNRRQALQAGLNILRSQQMMFLDLKIQQYRSFQYLFSTFDAAVTVAAIYILYPKDNPRYFEESFQKIKLLAAEFENMLRLNPLASAATSVLQALCARLTKATTLPGSSSVGMNPSATPLRWTPSQVGTSNADDSFSHRPSLASSGAQTEIITQPPIAYVGTMQQPQQFVESTTQQMTGFQSVEFDLEAMAPLYPTSDLLQHSLSSASMNVPHIPDLQGCPLYDSCLDWQFQGYFDSTSFWNFMNQTYIE